MTRLEKFVCCVLALVVVLSVAALSAGAAWLVKPQPKIATPKKQPYQAVATAVTGLVLALPLRKTPQVNAVVSRPGGWTFVYFTLTPATGPAVLAKVILNPQGVVTKAVPITGGGAA